MTAPLLVWYRNDLRLHDHAPLQRAIAAGGPVVPVYCFDPRAFGQTAFGFPKTGPFRAKFLRESVANLRENLRALGSDLVVRWGRPEAILPAIAREVGAAAAVYHEEVTQEELDVEAAVGDALEAIGAGLEGFWGSTLYHPDDLPFPTEALPDTFTRFRKAVERDAPVSPPLPPPDRLPPLPAIDPGELPSLADLGVEPTEPDPRGVLAFVGGETAGRDRLQTYVWERDCLRRYKETRNGMLGADYSSKFSPWLALGCLSPRAVWQQVQDYEAERVRNDSTYWLVFELLWRDYFRFAADRYGNRIFQPAGMQGWPIPWKQDWPRFDRWREGKTGYPLVDANMRELAATGFMSNRGRQNVASFLTKNLGIDWRMGAEWFESLLIDYDVCSNWGNWAYTAGVGNDARGFRFFNILKQGRDYDREGRYVKHWLPELANVPANCAREPWQLSTAEQQRCGLRLGVDYPHPVVDLFQSAAANERIYNEALAIAGNGRDR